MIAAEYLNTSRADMRISVPAYERMMQLYAFGNSNAQIVEILNNEFADIEFNQINQNTVKTLIANNRDEFDRARMELGLQCRQEIQRQLTVLFRATESVECEMVEVFVAKMKDALSELADLDLSEQDEDGRFTNTSRCFILIEITERLQKSVAKIVGTDALREIEIYRQKAKAKQAEEEGGLIPAFGRTVDEAPKTNFL